MFYYIEMGVSMMEWMPGDQPTQFCDQCGIGPFFYVSRREFPTLCLDCADAVIVSQRVPLNYVPAGCAKCGAVDLPVIGHEPCFGAA